jgi:predicted RNase H-like HicB family nuclease
MHEDRFQVSPNRLEKMEMKYAIVIEKSSNGFGAYAPDAPDCVACGETLEETILLTKDSLEFHFEGMMKDGEPIPESTSPCAYVEPEIVQSQVA